MPILHLLASLVFGALGALGGALFGVGGGIVMVPTCAKAEGRGAPCTRNTAPRKGAAPFTKKIGAEQNFEQGALMRCSNLNPIILP